MKYTISTIYFLAFSICTFAQNVGIGTTTPSDQLHTTGSVRFENYKGTNTRLVQMDSAGRLVVATSGGLFLNTAAQAIPDNGCSSANGITSQINITGQMNAVSAGKIAVRLNITHTFTGDLRIYLYPPGGTGVLVLASSNGSSGDNFSNTIFTDQAVNSINTGVAPFVGQYKPKGGNPECFAAGPPFATFAAIGGGTVVPNGTWTLRILDNASSDVGTLNSWSLSFTGADAYTTADQSDFIPKFSAGNLIASTIYQAPSGINAGNIGIGTINPTAKLEVAGTLKIVDGTEGAEKVLTSDASGNASWQTKTKFWVKGDYTCGTCNGSAPYFTSMVRNAYVELPHLRDTITKTGNYLLILTAQGSGVDEYNALYDATDNRSDYEGYLRVCPPGSLGNTALLQKDIFYTKYSNPSNTTVTFEYHGDDGEKSAIVFLNAGDIIKTFGFVTQLIGTNAPAQVNGWYARAQVKFILLN